MKRIFGAENICIHSGVSAFLNSFSLIRLHAFNLADIMKAKSEVE